MHSDTCLETCLHREEHSDISMETQVYTQKHTGAHSQEHTQSLVSPVARLEIWTVRTTAVMSFLCPPESVRTSGLVRRAYEKWGPHLKSEATKYQRPLGPALESERAFDLSCLLGTLL